MPLTLFVISSKVYELERELNMFKAKFVSLLSDKFKVVPSKLECICIWLPSCVLEYLADLVGAEEEGEADGEDVAHEQELLQLLQRESEGNDVFLNCKSTFKDEYGDQHDWHNDTTVRHYLCRQLYLHYTQQVK